MGGVAQLGQLLAKLESVRDRVGRECDERFDRAIAEFGMPRTYEGFRVSVGLFAATMRTGQHADESEIPRDTIAQMYREYISPYLTAEFRTDHTAFRIYLGELEGGRRDFLQKLFSMCERWQIETSAEALIAPFLREFRGFSFDEQCEVAEAYFAKYGHLLPSDVTSASPAMRAYLLEGLLRKHMSTMETFRNAARRVLK